LRGWPRSPISATSMDDRGGFGRRDQRCACGGVRHRTSVWFYHRHGRQRRRRTRDRKRGDGPLWQAGRFIQRAIQTYEAKFTPVENFRVGAATALAYYGVAGVPGLMDNQQTTLQGLSFDARYRLIDNERGPFSLTIIAEPRWDRLDDISGAAVNG
jgi:hypothetical protein